MLCLQCMQCAECTGNPSPVPANATFACPSPALPGAVCNATCDAGYIGNPSATCLADGSYSAVNGTCSLIREYLLVHLHFLTLDTVFVKQRGSACQRPTGMLGTATDDERGGVAQDGIRKGPWSVRESEHNSTMRALVLNTRVRVATAGVAVSGRKCAGEASHMCNMHCLLLLLTKQHQMLCLQCMQSAECTGNPEPAPDNATFACPSPALPGTVCNATCDTGYSGTLFAACQADGSYSAVNGTCVIRESQSFRCTCNCFLGGCTACTACCMYSLSPGGR
jgi:hypothetical protein